MLISAVTILHSILLLQDVTSVTFIIGHIKVIQREDCYSIKNNASDTCTLGCPRLICVQFPCHRYLCLSHMEEQVCRRRRGGRK